MALALKDIPKSFQIVLSLPNGRSRDRLEMLVVRNEEIKEIVGSTTPYLAVGIPIAWSPDCSVRE